MHFIFSLITGTGVLGAWVVLTCRVDACCGATGERRPRSLGVALPPRKEMRTKEAQSAPAPVAGWSQGWGHLCFENGMIYGLTIN